MELLAILHGLRIAWDRGFRKVVCYSDSYLAVALVTDPPSPFHVMVVLIHNIVDMLHRSWEVRLLHTLHEGNFCADFLVKMEAQQDSGFLLVQDPSPDLEPLLLADSMGSVFIRL
ncbi:uncharacterized protein LOC130744861 [Lotus japonicus]|uniref:uncharacterized protein LOC130744861 n=1 Tax=Lotus japonicus TaxID=34305 RepID=UPI00258E65F0|nr:uncharacterized protein LOC130744861 [Lotus japonicus]